MHVVTRRILVVFLPTVLVFSAFFIEVSIIRFPEVLTHGIIDGFLGRFSVHSFFVRIIFFGSHTRMAKLGEAPEVIEPNPFQHIQPSSEFYDDPPRNFGESCS